MVRVPPRHAVVALVVLLAGCTGLSPFGPQTPTGGAESAQLVGYSSSGGTCVPSRSHNWSLSQRPSDGDALVEISGNAYVPKANYVVDSMTLTESAPGAYTLSVTTGEEERKPPRECNAQVRYTATVRIPGPHAENFTLRVVHDGTQVLQVTDDGGSSGAGGVASGHG